MASIFSKKINILLFFPFFFITFLNFLSSSSVFAAGIDPQDESIIIKKQEDAQKQHERESRRIEQKIKEKQEQRELLKPDLPDHSEQTEANISAEDIPCFLIRTIVLENSEDLSKRDKDNLTNNYVNKCLNINDMKKLEREITSFYVEKGFSTTSAKVTDRESMKEGVLKLIIIKGIIEDITLGGNTLKDKMKVFTAFPFLKGKTLMMRDIDQGVEQFNKLESNNAEIKVIPVKDSHSSKIEIENNESNTFNVNLGFDNSGQESTGKIRRKVTVSKDNLIGANDNFTFNFIENNDNESEKRFNRYYYGAFSIPFGYWTINGNYNYSKYMITVNGLNRDFKSYGSSDGGAFEIEKVLHRDQNSKTELSSSITLKGTETYVADVKTDTASRKLSILKINLRHKTKVLYGILSFDLSYHKGLSGFGAKEDEAGMPFDAPKAQFEKYGFDASYYTPFRIFNQNAVYHINLSSQYSHDVLFGSEKFSIGDSGTVRGFKEDSIQGDKGICLKNEISFNVGNIPLLGDVNQLLKNTEFFLGIDTGYVSETARKYLNLGQDGGSLTGWACGFKYHNDLVVFDFTYSEAIYCPSFIKETDYEIYSSISFDLDKIFVKPINKN